MSTYDLFEDGFPHGTVEGFDQGCRGGSCPGTLEFGMSCKQAKLASRNDYRYPRLVKAGKTPAEIALELGIAHTETPDAAQPLAERAKDPEPQEDAGAPVIETEAPAEVTPAAEDEAMGHPVEPTQEEPTMSTTTVDPPTITADRWTEGLSQRAKRDTLTEIRDACRALGHDVPTHGYIPHAALAAYAAAVDAGTISAPTRPETKPKAPRVKAPRKLTTKQRVKAPGLTDSELNAGIRAWAVEHDVPVSKRGKIATKVKQAWYADDPTLVTGAPKPAPDPDIVVVESTPEAREAFFAADAVTEHAPVVGGRAHQRYDGGWYVVRAIEPDGRVYITPLPDEAEGVDWLDEIIGPFHPSGYRFDEFTSSDELLNDLQEWDTRSDSTDHDDLCEKPGPFDPCGCAVRRFIEFLKIRIVTSTPAELDKLPNPEWASITVPEDIARLERALQFTLTQWATARDHEDELERLAFALADQVEINRTKFEQEKVASGIWHDLYEAAFAEAVAARRELEAERSKPLWRRIFR